MSDDSDRPSAKGRPTPSRKEAEAARRAQMKTPLTRKEKLQRERAAREKLRSARREALRTGQGSALPPRDRGPVKALVRDVVDRRFNIAEYLLPVLVVILIFSVIGSSATTAGAAFLWAFTIVGTVFDEILLVRAVRKALKEHLPEASHRGSITYAVLRSTQIRRFRLPNATIGRGEPLKSRYV